MDILSDLKDDPMTIHGLGEFMRKWPEDGFLYEDRSHKKPTLGEEPTLWKRIKYGGGRLNELRILDEDRRRLLEGDW